MPKFNIEVTFGLTTTVEADGISFDYDVEGVEDFSDNSYLSSSQEVETDGGELTFVVTAEDEYEAEEKARQVLDDDTEVTDYNGLTWLVTNVNIDVEKVEVPMTLERAIEILTALFERNDSITEEEQEALAYLLSHITRQQADIAAQQSQIVAVQGEIAALKAAAATTMQDDSGTYTRV